MERNIILRSPKLTLAARVCGDQLLFAPTHMFMFLSSMSIMEGNDPLEKLRTTYWSGYQANLMIWPWVQAANFTFVPLHHRVLVVNLVSLGEFAGCRVALSSGILANWTGCRVELPLERH